MDLSAFVGKVLEEQDGDVLREGIRVLSQALMKSEVAGLSGAERHERSGAMESPGLAPSVRKVSLAAFADEQHALTRRSSLVWTLAA